jgi:hypothetical protein
LGSRQFWIVNSPLGCLDSGGQPMDGSAGTTFWCVPVGGATGFEVVAAFLESSELAAGVA